MKTIDIKGKQYVTVNERLKHFRTNFPGYSLRSRIVSHEDGKIVMEAIVVDCNGVTLAIGHAYETEGTTFINKTSYVENCETSAWGRALACLGIGIDTDVCSADEVRNVAEYITDNQANELLDLVADAQIPLDKFLAYMKVNDIVNIPAKKFTVAKTAIKNTKEKKNASN